MAGLEGKTDKLERESTGSPIKKSIGIIGMGRIGEALLANLVDEYEDLGLESIYVYYREHRESRQQDEARVKGVIDQVRTSSGKFPIYSTSNLDELGKNSEIVVVTIGRKEGGGKRREDLTGQYFHDIKLIMDGLGNNNPTIFMATNPVTPNCLVAHLCSENENPRIIGFTRLDYLRAKHILWEWLNNESNRHIGPEDLDLSVLGPHGYGLIVTGIKIGHGQNDKLIYSNEQLSSRFLFGSTENLLERLSKETSEYGERVYQVTSPDGTPVFFANQIIESLKNILEGSGKDTVAVNVNLENYVEDINGNLEIPRQPTYMSAPVTYRNGVPYIDPNLKMRDIPHQYMLSLINTLRQEEGRIKDYLRNHRTNGYIKMMKHFDL